MSNARVFRREYVLSRTLGTGNFSDVRKCRHKFSRNMYAAKIMKLPKIKEGENEEVNEATLSADYADSLDMIQNEVNIMRQMKHANIIKFIDVFYDCNEVIVVTEMTEYGDLQDYITNESNIPEDTGRLFCLQIASAINYVHDFKIVHRDIKPENILLFKNSKTDTNFILKLCDFGLAEEITTMDGLIRVCGSPSFVAPEIIEFKSYGLAVDIWSMGILFYLILCSYIPFDDSDLSTKFEMIVEDNVEFPDSEWSSISKEAKTLIRAMLTKNPKSRLKASNVLYHRWFRKRTQQPRSEYLRTRFSDITQRTWKSAAVAISMITKLTKSRKTMRDDAVVSRTLIEETFSLSRSLQQNKLTKAFEKPGTNHHHSTLKKKDISIKTFVENNKLPPIQHGNSILNASSNITIDEMR